MAFVKGQSGNPAGKAKITLPDGRTLTELAREHTKLAVDTLVAITTGGEGIPHAAQASAASTLLDRGWGRPAQAVTLSGDAENPLHTRISMDNLSDEQLRAIASIPIGTGE